MSSYQDELKKVLLTYDMDKIKEFMYKHKKICREITWLFGQGYTKEYVICQTAQTKKKNFRENG